MNTLGAFVKQLVISKLTNIYWKLFVSDRKDPDFSQK